MQGRQDTEVAALAAIFQQEFLLLSAPGTQPLHYKIKVTPPQGATMHPCSAIWLTLRYDAVVIPNNFSRCTKNYPLQVPEIILEKISGLTELQLEQLAILLARRVRR